MLDKCMCIITVLLWKSPLYRSSILKCIQKLLMLVVQYFGRKILNFYKRFFINFIIVKALKIKQFCEILGKLYNSSLTLENFYLIFYHSKAFEYNEFCKFELTKLMFFKILSNFLTFPDFFQISLFIPDFCHFS